MLPVERRPGTRPISMLNLIRITFTTIITSITMIIIIIIIIIVIIIVISLGLTRSPSLVFQIWRELRGSQGIRVASDNWSDRV